MKLQDIPQEQWMKMYECRKKLFLESLAGQASIVLYNEEGTRYFSAYYIPSWGGRRAFWSVRYGEVELTKAYDDITGTSSYEWINGREFRKSSNGTIVPRWLDTRKEVVELANKIGIFGCVK